MFRKLRGWIRLRFHGRDLGNELDEELRFHLEMQIAESVRRGMNPEEARRTALLHFGGVEQVRLNCRDAWIFLDRLGLDITHAFRSMRARATATAATIGVLTLGISLTTVIFAVADPFLTKPLPYADPGRLVLIQCQMLQDRWEQLFQGPRLADWQARTDLFESLAVIGNQEQIRVRTPGGSAILKVTAVSENFLEVLGIPVTYALSWQPTGAKDVVLALLQGPRIQALGSPAELATRSFATLQGYSVGVAAVLPRGFLFPSPAGYARPDALSPTRSDAIVSHSAPGKSENHTIIARLRPGVGLESVRAAFSSKSAQIPYTVEVRSLSEYMAGNLRSLALGALAVGLLVSLVCAANVAHLLIARGSYRTREFATREALGASRRDLLRLILVELASVASLAILVSLALARMIIIAMTQMMPAQYTSLGEPAVTLRVTAFAILLGAGIVLVAMVPAGIVWRTSFSSVIHRSLASEARKLKWLRSAMAAGQSATAMVLLVGGALLVRSYWNLWSQDTGFSGDVGMVSVSYPKESAVRLAQEIDNTIERLRRIPDVIVAGATSSPFLDNVSMAGGVRATKIAGRTVPLFALEVTAGFFEAVGARGRAGRMLDQKDRGWSAVVANESFARWLLPNRGAESVIGQTGSLPDGSPIEIVGVVQDTFNYSLDKKPSPRLYMPVTRPWGNVQYVLRLRNRSTAFETAARRAIAGVNPDAAVMDIGFLDDRLAGTVDTRSFATLILSLFTVAGLGVTASGLFGIVAFVVARRTRELAIRKAVGAQARHIIWEVVREAVAAAAFGSAAGLLLGRWLSVLLKNQLYGVNPGDTATLVMVAILMVMVVALAAWIPAQRAARLSTTEALRIE